MVQADLQMASADRAPPALPPAANEVSSSAWIENAGRREALSVLRDLLHKGEIDEVLQLSGRLPEDVRRECGQYAFDLFSDAVEDLGVADAEQLSRVFTACGGNFEDQAAAAACLRVFERALKLGRDEAAQTLLRVARLPLAGVRRIVEVDAVQILRRIGWCERIVELQRSFGLPAEIPPGPAARDAGLLAVCTAARRGRFEDIAAISRFCALPREALLQTGWNLLAEEAAKGWTDKAEVLAAAFELGGAAALCPGEARSQLRSGLQAAMRAGRQYAVAGYCGLAVLNTGDITAAVGQVIGEIDSLAKAEAVLKGLGPVAGTPWHHTGLPNWSSFDQRWVRQFQLATLEEILTFSADHYPYLRRCRRAGEVPQLTAKEISCLRSNRLLSASESIPLSDTQADWLKSHKGDRLLALLLEKNYEGLLSALIDLNYRWKDAFRHSKVAEMHQTIGAREIFELVYDPNEGASPERLLTIAELVSAAGLSYREARYSVLERVRADNAAYGTFGHTHDAWTELANILQRCSFNLGRVKQSAECFGAIELLSECVSHFADRPAIFTSWKSIRSFDKLERAVRDQPFMEGLLDLQRSNKPLYNCLATLCFHPDSNLSPETLRQFWREPAKFFERRASYTSDALQQQILPQRMVDGSIPGLDLTGAELRDALINGVYDQLLSFTPMQIEFRIPKSGIWYETARAALKAALGERSKGLPGRAEAGRKVYHAARAALAQEGVDLLQYLSGGAQVSPELERSLFDLAYDPAVGIREEWMTITATLHRKSDPLGIIAGDDTACCMPFGDGKNNIYFCDPNVALFTVRLQLQEGNLRTIAQSVVSRELRIGQDFKRVNEGMFAPRADIRPLLRQQPRHTGEIVTVLDNIEPAKNFTTQLLNSAVLAVYRDFWSEYAARFGAEEGMDCTQVMIGKAYTQAAKGVLALVPDRTLSLTAPIGYSDRVVGDDTSNSTGVYGLPLTQGHYLFPKTVRAPERSSVGRVVDDGVGIRPLSFTDTVPVAWLQSVDTEHGRHAGIDGIQALKVLLIASAVNNRVKERPNLSFKLTDGGGCLLGHLIAFEGRGPNRERIVIVHDLVPADVNSPGSRELLEAFAAACERSYPEAGVRPAIRMPLNREARQVLRERLGEKFEVM